MKLKVKENDSDVVELELAQSCTDIKLLANGIAILYISSDGTILFSTDNERALERLGFQIVNHMVRHY